MVEIVFCKVAILENKCLAISISIRDKINTKCLSKSFKKYLLDSGQILEKLPLSPVMFMVNFP